MAVVGFSFVAATGFALEQYATRPRCLVEPTQQLRVGASDWTVQIRGFACGFGIGGGTDIVAVSQKTFETKLIAKGDDVVRASLALKNDTAVIITLPNRSNVSTYVTKLPGLDITFNYIPVDDKEDRQKYKLWSEDRLNQANRAWYCKNVLPGFPEPSRSNINNAIAYELDFEKDPKSRRPYCDNDVPVTEK